MILRSTYFTETSRLDTIWRETNTGAALPPVRTEKKRGGDLDHGAETETGTADGRGPGPGTERETGRGAGAGRGRRGNGIRTVGAEKPRRGRESPRVRRLTRPETQG